MDALVASGEIGTFLDGMIYCRESTITKINKIWATGLDLSCTIPRKLVKLKKNLELYW